MYDLLILGGGPAGYAAGIAAGRMGKKVALFEASRVGGTCLNVGCIPTKYLLDKGSLMEKIRDLTDQGIFRDAGAFSFSRIVQGKDKVVQTLTDGVAGLLKRNHVELIPHPGTLVNPETVTANGTTYQGKHVLICTGSETVFPPIPGGKDHCVTSTELLSLQHLPSRLAVIGGGVIGIELASAFCAFGSQVTVLEMMPQLFPGEEPDIVRAVSSRLKKQGIQILTKAKVTAISATPSGKSVHYEVDGKAQILEADVVLMAVGRKAALSGIDAATLGLDTEMGAIKVDQYMHTNLPNVWAAGDVIGGWQLAHSAYAEADAAIHNMFHPDAQRPAKLDLMPHCVYTIPPFASVGITRAAARQAGIKVRSGKFPYGASGMALAEDEHEGFVLVHIDADTNRLLGAHLYGACAHELITTMSLAISAGLTVEDWERTIVPHPSLSEGLEEAVLKSVGRARHIL